METPQEQSAPKCEPATGTMIPSARKRVSRACDECRLHKARCDGTKSCATCAQSGRECSYSLLPSDTKGPNAKLRILQRRLFRAQQVIQDLQKQVPSHESVDDYICLDTSSKSTSIAVDPAITALPPTNLLFGVDCGKNSAFAPNLIHSLLRSVSDNSNIISLLTSATAHFTSTGPHGIRESPAQTFCQLTPYSTMLEIVYAAFSNVFGLCTIVPEQDFRVRTQRLYDVNPIAYEVSDTTFMPLFFSVVALGMVYSSNLHPSLDYHHILRESDSYSRAAMATVKAGREYESPICLQIALCRVLYLLNTSRLDLANSVLKTVCKSFMVQQLIRSVSTLEPAHIDFSDMSSRNIVWTVFYLDMHISSLMDVPTSLPPPGLEVATTFAINTAIYNVANYRRSESAFLLSVSVAMAIELMKLAQLMSDILGKFEPPEGQRSVEGKATIQNSPTLDEVRKQCETWEVLLQAAYPDDDNNPALLMVRRHLQMHLHLIQITLYHPSLGTRSSVLPWNHVPRVDEFKEEDACIQAAVDAVKYTSRYLKQEQTNMIPWHSAYVIFISVITLLIAATSMNPSDRHTTQGTINSAMLILSNSTYGSSHAKSCYIQFIQKLSDILKPRSPSKTHAVASSTTRRSSFSSDTSTLVALNEAITPHTTFSNLAPSRIIPHQPFNLVSPRPLPSEEDTTMASDWGFD